MYTPLWSIATLATEVVVTTAVFAVIWQGYMKGIFMRPIAFGVLAYEFLFNITYMASKEIHAAKAPAPLNPYLTALAIFHGIFSLIMFAALVAFFIWASRRYATGSNAFAERKYLTYSFVVAWSISILSGILLFADLYL